MFDGHLWQKQATLCVINDQESVASEFDSFWKNWLQRGKQGYLDAHLLELGRFQG